LNGAVRNIGVQNPHDRSLRAMTELPSDDRPSRFQPASNDRTETAVNNLMDLLAKLIAQEHLRRVNAEASAAKSNIAQESPGHLQADRLPSEKNVSDAIVGDLQRMAGQTKKSRRKKPAAGDVSP
jgi:hypothetical protein